MKQSYSLGFDLEELPDPTDLELEEIELEQYSPEDLQIESVYEGFAAEYDLTFRGTRIA